MDEETILSEICTLNDRKVEASRRLTDAVNEIAEVSALLGELRIELANLKTEPQP